MEHWNRLAFPPLHIILWEASLTSVRASTREVCFGVSWARQPQVLPAVEQQEPDGKVLITRLPLGRLKGSGYCKEENHAFPGGGYEPTWRGFSPRFEEGALCLAGTE